MISALILAACLLPPLWDIPDQTEACAVPTIDCACTEITWDPPLSGPVDSYEVQRQTFSGGTWATVGFVNGWTDEEGVIYTPAPVWHVFHASAFPHATTAYRYRVRACNIAGCSLWSNTAATRGWPEPVCIDDTGREEQCYVGAVLRLR